MKNIADNQTTDRRDDGPVYRSQRNVHVSGRSEDTSEDYIRPHLPHHGNRHTGERSNERREPTNRRAPVSQPALPADASDIKMMALMRQDQEDRLYDAEMTRPQERHQDIHNSTTRSRQDEESYNTEEFSNYSTGVESSSQNQYEQSPAAYFHSEGRIDRSGAPSTPSSEYNSTASPTTMPPDFVVQEDEGQTVVAFPIIPTQFDGKPQAKTEEERAKPQKYWWLALTMVIVALIVAIVVVVTVGMKGNDDTSESSDDPPLEPLIPEPTTPEPTTPKPTTPEPNTPTPTTPKPSTVAPTTPEPTTPKPSTVAPTTPEPTTQPTTIPVPWEQYGSDINGESAGDQFGFLIALSGDGSTIAGTAHKNDDAGEDAGSVRVFRFKGNSWTQIGQDIDGVPGESAFSMPVATSYDGSTVAIGGSLYGSTHERQGRVRVLKYNSATDRWNTLGGNIICLAENDYCGSSVSLSGNGRMLAVGASGGDMNGENSGLVAVLEYNDERKGWDQVGQTISGEKSNDKAGELESVKLSNDGETLAIGSRFNDGAGVDAGHVRVFRYDQAAYEWTQIGQDIEEANTGGSHFGLSLDLSRDGIMIAIGAFGYQKDGKENCGLVQVYEYYDGNEKWNKEFDLTGYEGAECGISVSLSGDGKKVAFGCAESEMGGEGQFGIFEYNDDLYDWVQTSNVAGEHYLDNFGTSVSLSDEGNVVAVGGHGNDGNGVNSGHIRVYKLVDTEPTTPEPTSPPPINPGTWTKYGLDINGESAGDQFGYLMALSGDGSTIAGAAPRNDGGGEDAGSVRVFRFKGNSWTQIGQDIDGVQGESAFSMPVATSYDGSTVAVGGQYYGSTHERQGRVRVLEYNSVTDRWNTLGGNFICNAENDFCGSSVSLSGSGRILAFGANGGDMNGENSGFVAVFEYDDGTKGWDQVGQTISGENSNDRAGEWESVKLSNDGETVAIGSRFNDGLGVDRGHVRVFRYDQAANEWTQLGQDIEEANTGNIHFGLSVDLSRDGTMIAIGAQGYEHDGKENRGLVEVYHYDHGDEKWYKTFGVRGLEGDECGTSVSLSGDGKKVAFGCPQFGIGKEGELLIWQYSDDLKDWVQTLYVVGEKILDHFGTSVSLSDEGNVVAAGGHGNDGNGVLSGHIRVYKLQ